MALNMFLLILLCIWIPPQFSQEVFGCTSDRHCSGKLICIDGDCTSKRSSGEACSFSSDCEEFLVCIDKICESGISAACKAEGDCEKKLPLPAIIGGVLGGLLVIVIVVVGVWTYRRAQKRKNRSQSDIEQSSNDPAASSGNVTPTFTPSLAGESFNMQAGGNSGFDHVLQTDMPQHFAPNSVSMSAVDHTNLGIEDAFILDAEMQTALFRSLAPHHDAVAEIIESTPNDEIIPVNEAIPRREQEANPRLGSAEPQSRSDNANSCLICKEEYLKGDRLSRLPCLHEYHADCIEPWLSRKATCPVDRLPIGYQALRMLPTRVFRTDDNA